MVFIKHHINGLKTVSAYKSKHLKGVFTSASTLLWKPWAGVVLVTAGVKYFPYVWKKWLFRGVALRNRFSVSPLAPAALVLLENLGRETSRKGNWVFCSALDGSVQTFELQQWEDFYSFTCLFAVSWVSFVPEPVRLFILIYFVFMYIPTALIIVIWAFDCRWESCPPLFVELFAFHDVY